MEFNLQTITFAWEKTVESHKCNLEQLLTGYYQTNNCLPGQTLIVLKVGKADVPKV